MPSTPAAAARQILVRLQEVMAARTSAQAKLNKVVEIIGETLDSEVCSIYLLRDGLLELFATRGLNQSAVHVTKLGVGEGENLRKRIHGRIGRHFRIFAHLIVSYNHS